MSFNLSVNAIHDAIASYTELFNALTASVHSYATDTNIALAFGGTAPEIFEAARLDVDSFIRLKCPKAAEQLLAAYEPIQGGGAEESAQALVSCRRSLRRRRRGVPTPCRGISRSSGKRIARLDQKSTRIACSPTLTVAWMARQLSSPFPTSNTSHQGWMLCTTIPARASMLISVRRKQD